MARYVTELLLRQYKSIGQCRVSFDDLTLFVGPNGAGKSNIVDALRFVCESLLHGLDFAIRQRGGIDVVRRRSTGHPTHFGIRLNLRLADGTPAFYAFEVGSQPNGAYSVVREVAHIADRVDDPTHYEVRKGEITEKSQNLPLLPSSTTDRLLLVLAAGVPALRPLYDILTGMHFYNINPAEIKVPQLHEAGDVLSHTGRNIAAVIKQMNENAPETVKRMESYLQTINPVIEGMEHKSFGPQETLEFRQRVQNNKHPWRFLAHAMSDGTLRSIGLLTALFQQSRAGALPALVGPEEPEITIHPGAAAVIMDALIEASRKIQIVATTHSPELLDHPDLAIDNVRVVRSVDGETFVSCADAASREAVRSQLYTAGDLLRRMQLQPEPGPLEPVTQMSLFEAA